MDPILESAYQARLIKKLYRLFPGIIVLKNDPAYLQGIPDLTLLFPGGFWATLEVKAYEDAAHQPNQDYYVDLMHGMSFSAFIFPENEEAVLHGLQQASESHWHAFSSEP